MKNIFYSLYSIKFQYITWQAENMEIDFLLMLLPYRLPFKLNWIDIKPTKEYILPSLYAASI